MSCLFSQMIAIGRDHNNFSIRICPFDIAKTLAPDPLISCTTSKHGQGVSIGGLAARYFIAEPDHLVRFDPNDFWPSG
jgi:hypothetical protein